MHKVYGTNRKFALHSLPTRMIVVVHVDCNFSLLCLDQLFCCFVIHQRVIGLSCSYPRKLFYNLVNIHATSLVGRLRWHRNPNRWWWHRNIDGLQWHRNTNGLRWHTQHECAGKRVNTLTHTEACSDVMQCWKNMTSYWVQQYKLGPRTLVLQTQMLWSV